VRMGRIVGGPYSTNKNLTALSTENLIDTFSYTPGVGGPYSQASKAMPDRWKSKQLGTTTAKGAATSCGYGGTVMGNALFVRPPLPRVPSRSPLTEPRIARVRPDPLPSLSCCCAPSRDVAGARDWRLQEDVRRRRLGGPEGAGADARLHQHRSNGAAARDAAEGAGARVQHANCSAFSRLTLRARLVCFRSGWWRAVQPRRWRRSKNCVRSTTAEFRSHSRRGSRRAARGEDGKASYQHPQQLAQTGRRQPSSTQRTSCRQ
jgi:hypothetical protein